MSVSEEIIEKSWEIGFEQVSNLDVSTLKTYDWVRSECAENKCRMYNKVWTCPPNCGTLQECGAHMRSYSSGILLQTVGSLKGPFDAEGYSKAEKIHRQRLIALNEYLHMFCSNALCLGAGGCSICEKCSFPEPCRFPEKALSSMEGYGLFVTEVCRKNNVKYHYGPNTICYTACALF